MGTALLITVLLCAVTGLSLVARRANIPYPVAFVLGGTLLAFIPNLPQIHLNPDVVFLVVLPPLLFGAAWSTDWVDFRRNARPIGFLAIGLVVFTTVAVAVVAHELRPALSWPLAFVMGAIVAPTDTIAAEAILEKLAVPRRIAAILSGESLVNDASALVIYRLAIAAVAYGTFSLARGVVQFFVVSLGGIAIGIAIALIIEGTIRLLRSRHAGDPALINVISLLAPYASYLPAEALGVSGVLSTVTAGIYLGRRSAQILDSESRLVGESTWQVFIFILNGFVFVVLGSQLRGIVSALSAVSSSPTRIALDAIGISVLVILLRIVWVFPATYLPYWTSKRTRERDPAPSWRYVLIVAWTGMRGIVSLAAALAIPTIAAGNVPVHARNEMIFITFCVIFATLVVQGCTLAPMIRWLGISETSSRQREETEVRIRALRAGIERLRQLERRFESPIQWETAGRILSEYGQRIDHLQGHLDAEGTGSVSHENEVDHELQEAALMAEREAILQMRALGQIPDAIFRNIQFDLDLAEVRLR